MEVGVIVLFLAFLLIAAPFISSSTKIPITVVEILLGVFGAYLGILKQIPVFDLLSHLGFLYLMFLVGMEVNLKEFGSGKTSVLKRTFVFFAIVYTLAASATFYFQLNIAYIAIFSVFSLGILMTLLKEYGRKETWLAIAINIGIIGELISIIVIIILSSGLASGFGLQFFVTIAILVGFLALFVMIFKIAKVLFWWFPELKIFLMPYHDSKEIDIRLSMAMMFGMIALMIMLGIDQVLGAFLAGFFLVSFFNHKTDLPEKLNSFGFGFFVPLFFIHVGSTLPVNALASIEVIKLAIFIAAMIISIRFIASMTAYSGYLGVKNTILFSLGNSIPLTFLVAVATLAKKAGAINDTEYYAVVVASMISAVALLIVIKILRPYLSSNKLENKT